MSATDDRKATEELLMLWAFVRHDPGTHMVMSDALYHALRAQWLAARDEEVPATP